MSQQTSEAPWWIRGTLWGVLSLLALGRWSAIGAEAEQRVGQFITIPSPITDSVVQRVRRAARKVLDQHLTENQRPVLIFEIQPGQSTFEDCRKLANFIREELAGADTTVAYVPQTLTGHAVMIALACRELVLHPGAQIGDIGHSERGPPDQVQRIHYTELARQRGYSEAVVLGMLDRDLEVMEVQVDGRHRYALRAELEDLRNRPGILVGETRTIKAPGAPLLIPASEARTRYGLAKLLAQDRAEVASHYHLPAQSVVEDPTLGQQPNAVLIQVEGPIEWILEDFLQRQLTRALAHDANLIILEIDSPGGLADASIDLANRIRDIEKARTVAYIPSGDYGALSGAAFLALACDVIYMHPEAPLGDAGPIMAAGGRLQDLPPDVRAKQVSHLSTQLANIAESKGRPRALAEAMVDRELVVYEVRNVKTGVVTYMSDHEIQKAEHPQDWQKVRTVTREGRYLEVSGKEAVELGLAKETLESFDELMSVLGLDSPPPVYGKTWVDDLVYVLRLPGVTMLLFVVGLICLYIELQIPGITLAGIGAGLCFLVFFWSRVLGGTAGWLEVMLFLAGLLCLALELFVIPGFGVMGLSGILLLLFSIVLASQTFVLPTSPARWEVTLQGLWPIVGALMIFIVAAAILGRYFPSIPLVGRLVLTPPHLEDIREELTEGVWDAEGHRGVRTVGLSQLLGKQGLATTTLRPAGKARFGDEYVDVVAEGSYIAEGSRVEVIEVSGNRVVVKQLS